MTDGFATAGDGVRLFYERVGTGDRVVLVPNGWYLRGELERLAPGRTIVCFDPRNRGRSDAVADETRPARGVHDDVDDIDAVRRHFGASEVDLVGHSYVGAVVALHAMKFPEHTRRVVQIGAIAFGPPKEYPAALTNSDDVLTTTLARLRELEKERAQSDAIAFCRRFWAILSAIYVVDPADAGRANWSRCELPNERGFMKSWLGSLLPSIHALAPSTDDFARASAPVLAIHGRKDRSSPYGAGREWAMRLPNARLLTLDAAAHAPWIEEPGATLEAIETFLAGEWPRDAEKVTQLDVTAEAATNRRRP